LTARREGASEVKDFYELDDWKQCELPFELIECIGRVAAFAVNALFAFATRAKKP
jgi:hypothetical protein